ncbi:hypothetical protein RvY_01194 [Ramazzottius varieornatus]|uniref:C-type lectin domain-containing protein n=1 Tax=Ramazzottius varieornatus TaxID=947166 RepID=A0A1D1UML7_RAMVA|nr:hypothetical protein RvY_01194 [Ramazzottius varieornatus]
MTSAARSSSLKTHILAGVFLVFCGNFFLVRGDRACPYGWVKHSKSCYFAGTAWTRLTYYDAIAFCHSLKAHLVEFNTLSEYKYITATAMNYPWWNGPWIGMLKPFDGYDKSWILPSTQAVTKDSDLNRVIDAAALRDTGRCGGLNRRGGGFGFWDCGGQDTFSSEPQKGSPWCEIDLDLDN